ncbi:MAG: TRAP transporter large permease [Rhodospirillales bacterium]|nr:TRAP transporter large permease [Rhodospirillales bacterium]
MTAVLVGFVILLVLILAGLPIAFAMGLVGFGGVVYILGWHPAMAMVAQITYETGMNYGLSVVPLFILMGNFVTRAGLSEQLYVASNAWLGHRRGGLAMATIVACAGFSAICGSSLATAATMAKVSMPSMRRFGYAPSLAAGSIAAGGTLGILIPPSVILVIYGIITSSDIGALFIAGIIPGMLGVLGYLAAIAAVTAVRPEMGPRGEATPMRERLRALSGVWGVLMLFVLVIGGIYLGVFTPTEAAGIGAAGAFFFALFRRALTLRTLIEVLGESAQTTAMIFFVLFGALLFSNFMNLIGLPTMLLAWVETLGASPMLVLVAILAIYLLLGCLLESMSMVLLTVPIFYPLMQAMGFDLIWFGIVVVVVTEISLITPPVGLNVFVLKAVLPDTDTATIFRGVTPFWAADIVRLGLIVFVPWFSLVLPNLMKAG